MKCLEIIQAEITPMIIPISSIQSVVFRAKYRGDDDAVLLNILGWDAPIVSAGPNANLLYCRIKELLAPEPLEF